MVGNVLPLGQIPEGTVVSNVEARPGDRGTFSRTSGAYAVIVAQVCICVGECVAGWLGGWLDKYDGLWGELSSATRYLHGMTRHNRMRTAARARSACPPARRRPSPPSPAPRCVPCALHSFLPSFLSLCYNAHFVFRLSYALRPPATRRS